MRHAVVDQGIIEVIGKWIMKEYHVASQPNVVVAVAALQLDKQKMDSSSQRNTKNLVKKGCMRQKKIFTQKITLDAFCVIFLP